MKICGKCFSVKNDKQFYKGKTGLHAWCIECNKLYKIENKEKIAAQKNHHHKLNKNEHNQSCRNYRSTSIGRAKDLFRSAKKRAIDKKIEFNICFEQVLVLVLIGKCSKSGICFDLSKPVEKIKRKPFAPSLDRIDSFKGYTPENIQIVCNLYNAGKGQHTDEEFIEFCKKVVEYQK